MPISIQNPKAEKLARKVAAENGISITKAIIIALEEHLERLSGKRTAPDLAQELLDISSRCSALPDLDLRSPEEILDYNNFGVPE